MNHKPLRFQPGDLRTLGKTGLKVSPLALGTVKIGRNTHVKYPQGFSLPDDHQVLDILATAIDLGINLIDTAPAYGTSEMRLGQLLPRTDNQWIVCTKAGETYSKGRSTYDFTSQAMNESVSSSLRRLKRDYIDIVLVHSNGEDSKIIQATDALEALQKLKDKGLVRFIGMSTKTKEGSLLALPHVDVLMVSLDEGDQAQGEVIGAAHKQNVGILLKKVLASGHSTNVGASLASALSITGVHSAVIGSINPAHLKANVAAALDQ